MKYGLFAIALAGCVTVEDLGSHALTDGGSSSSSGGGHAFAEAGAGGNGTIFFTTNGRWTGNLGGLDGADSLCTTEAQAAGLSGSFKAWLSTSKVNAKDRIAGTGPWKFVTGEQVFTIENGMFTPSQFLHFDARGNDLLFTMTPNVWTGTGDFGVLDASNATCRDWTSDSPQDNGSFGQLSWISTLWTHDDVDGPLADCSQMQRLYCFQQ